MSAGTQASDPLLAGFVQDNSRDGTDHPLICLFEHAA